MKSLITFALFFPVLAFSQTKHYSTEADVNYPPCIDTVKVLGRTAIEDIGRIFPTWVPVAGNDTVVVVEGVVSSRGEEHKESGAGPHVAFIDLSLFHYTHDFCFNIYPDSGYTNLLGYEVHGTGAKNPLDDKAVEDNKLDKVYRTDTVRQHDLHVEWETGLGQANDGNPCAELNKRGESCGFASVGHSRKDIIWNWPTTGDWVHVEGLWIWDRGHPPAETEIHPMRFVATRRALPAKIEVDSSYKFATRVDIYANGDGGAFNNNRVGQPDFVHLVKMSRKDYVFTVKNTLPKPSDKAKLRYKVVTQKGNSFSGPITCEVKGDECKISILWREGHVGDGAVLAKTVYLYWDEGTGVQDNYITAVKVKVNKLKIRRKKEFMNRSEFRVFMEVGGNWLFLNELYGKDDDILNKGLGKTNRRNWKINKEFTLYLPGDQSFRMYVTGWEADGIDRTFGHITNPEAGCNAETKKLMREKLVSVKNVGLHGCLDDHFGEGAVWHTAPSIPQGVSDFTLLPYKGRNSDVCPCSKYKLEKGYRLYYTIEKLK